MGILLRMLTIAHLILLSKFFVLLTETRIPFFIIEERSLCIFHQEISKGLLLSICLKLIVITNLKRNIKRHFQTIIVLLEL